MQVANIDGYRIYLAEPEPIPPCNFVGRKDELALCKAAWGINNKTNRFKASKTPPLNFRLHGLPGVGKNEIVYQLARLLHLDLYIISGHEQLTPEDLSVVLVPDPEIRDTQDADSIPLILQASPLATAIYKGGLFFFDEINRVPERTLSPLSSVLDGRLSLYSSITGLYIKPKNKSAEKRFRFCCALNPSISDSGRVLPEYIEQRTLPIIEIGEFSIDEMIEIIPRHPYPQELLENFEKWYHKQKQHEISIRQVHDLRDYAMHYQEKYSDDTSRLKQALELQKKELGEAHPEVERSLKTLVEIYEADEEYQDVESLYKDLISIEEKKDDRNYEQIANYHYQLATLYRRIGKYDEAVRQLKEGLDIFKERPEVKERQLASNILNELGIIHRRQGKYRQSVSFYKRSLRIEKSISHEHPDIATTFNNLGMVNLDRGKYAEAENFFLKTLIIQEGKYGPGHLNIAVELNNLGHLYWIINLLRAAELFSMRALIITKNEYGENHTKTAFIQDDLSRLYISTGKLKEAFRLCNHALQIRKITFEEKHPRIAKSYHNLARYYQLCGEYNRAEDYYKKALDILSDRGENKCDIATIIHNMGTLYCDQKMYEYAEDSFTIALDIRKEALGPDYPHIADTLKCLAFIYKKTGKEGAACSLQKQAQKIQDKTQLTFAQHPEILSNLQQYSKLLSNSGLLEESNFLKRRITKIKGT